MTVLGPGANAPLTSNDLTVLIRHGTIPGADIDVSAFLVTASGKVRSDGDMCFYGQPSVAGGAVAFTGSENGESRFTVGLGQVPAGVEKVVFTATIHENRASFSRVPEITLDAGGVRGAIPCAGMTETALILAELYQRNGAWKFRVVGQGFNGGLSALAKHLGVEIAEPAPPAPTPPPAPAPTPAPPPPPAPTPTPTPTPASSPAPTPVPPPSTSSVNLSKVSLTKQNNTVSLTKEGGRFGKMQINLNWNQSQTQKKTGFFSRGSVAIDLDLGAFVETRDGKKHVIQALGNGFGDFQQAPFVRLLGDDRTGSTSDGEWLEINGDRWADIKRVLVYAFIYEGVPNWKETDGIVRVLVPGQPEVEIRMNEFEQDGSMCAVVGIDNHNGQVRVSRQVTFFSGHKALDKQYDWGFRWTAGRK
jgi:tellurite resistance protein TerA